MHVSRLRKTVSTVSSVRNDGPGLAHQDHLQRNQPLPPATTLVFPQKSGPT